MSKTAESHFHMVDVGGKPVTARTSTARGTLRMSRQAFNMLKAGRLPKGDALKLGEAAGVLAAKRTPEAIPLCHPIPLDKIDLRFEFDDTAGVLHAFCEVSASAKTGVEMEALSGVMGALLTVYDLVKQVDAALTIADVRLISKKGGKSGLWRHPAEGSIYPSPPPSPKGRGEEQLSLSRSGRGQGEGRIKLGTAGVITVSDRCFGGSRQDVSGPILAEGLKEIGFETGAPVIVPDDKKKIEQALRRLARGCDVVLLTGGTGLSPRDVTPEVLESVSDRLIPGIGESLRAAGIASTPISSLSRSVAGQLGRCLVVALPGSMGGAKDGLKVLAELLPHAVHVLKGGDHG